MFAVNIECNQKLLTPHNTDVFCFEFRNFAMKRCLYSILCNILNGTTLPFSIKVNRKDLRSSHSKAQIENGLTCPNVNVRLNRDRECIQHFHGKITVWMVIILLLYVHTWVVR